MVDIRARIVALEQRRNRRLLNRRMRKRDAQNSHSCVNAFKTTKIREYFLSDTLADIYFVFDSGKRIPAHKLILVASNVFKIMFTGLWRSEQEIRITESPAAFIEFLQFFYVSAIKLTVDNVVDVMHLAYRYEVEDCKAACWELLRKTHCAANACMGYQLAARFKQNDMLKKSSQMIVSRTQQVVNSAAFLNSDRTVLEYIMKQNLLLCTEFMLFETVMAWVKHKSTEFTLTRDVIDDQMGDLFFDFRFRSMSLSEFVSLLPMYGHLFTAEEREEITKLITAVPGFVSRHFSNRFRQGSRHLKRLTRARPRYASYSSNE